MQYMLRTTLPTVVLKLVRKWMHLKLVEEIELELALHPMQLTCTHMSFRTILVPMINIRYIHACTT